MKKCQKCNVDIDDDSGFCSVCGARQDMAQTAGSSEQGRVTKPAVDANKIIFWAVVSISGLAVLFFILGIFSCGYTVYKAKRSLQKQTGKDSVKEAITVKISESVTEAYLGAPIDAAKEKADASAHLIADEILNKKFRDDREAFEFFTKIESDEIKKNGYSTDLSNAYADRKTYYMAKVMAVELQKADFTSAGSAVETISRGFNIASSGSVEDFDKLIADAKEAADSYAAIIPAETLKTKFNDDGKTYDFFKELLNKEIAKGGEGNFKLVVAYGAQMRYYGAKLEKARYFHQ